MRRRRAFSLVEVLVALIFLMLAAVGLFGFFSSSSRNAHDACRETVARSLAQEALEWVGGLGYEALLRQNGDAASLLARRFAPGRFQPIDILPRDDGSVLYYPPEYQQFERQVELEHSAAERLFVVRVTVRPRGDLLLRRGSIVLEKVVGAEYD